MKYKLYRLSFTDGVHFGRGSLESGEYTFFADTLFSALCQEAGKETGERIGQLTELVRKGRLLFSDAMPYQGDRYYVPKPMLKILQAEDSGNSQAKKIFKKLKYIPLEYVDAFVSGRFPVEQADGLEDLGYSEMKVSAFVRTGEETLPYRIETWYFNPGNGLYLLVGYEGQDELLLAEDLLDRLSFSGIGGRRNSGLGRYTLYTNAVPEPLLTGLASESSLYMTLSVSLPTEAEMKQALEGADFRLIRRSGFVASAAYADEPHRKKDLFLLAAGSCVRQRFQGDVCDVSAGGSHPVYRYAKPMLLGVGK